ncbi:MAG: tetratricopeptide repeat protein [bacterium]|nr:tetratricopeptide repeat protein [bacterium]
MIEQVGPYKFLRLLGEGGMGQVYEALDMRDETRVAVKLLRGGSTATARERELFAREARVGMDLNHPGLVAVLAVEIVNVPQPYLVMEYLPGPTLKGAIDSAPLSPLSTLSLLIDILDTLRFVHAEGIIHRDIKTGNLMLDAVGKPRLMDFGLTTFSDETSMSRTGLIFGSPHYMAPEQGLGEPLDSRSDLFSLGVVLYELLTGRLPFKGTSPLSVIYAIINQEPSPLRRSLPDLPESFDWVLTRALAKSRSERYQDAVTFSDDLKALVDLLQGKCAEEDLSLSAVPGRMTVGEERFPLPLAGREREIARLTGWFRERSGPALCFLGGEAGVGKTRLVRESLRHAGLSAPATMVGRTQPGREDFPYQPWLAALRPALRERDLYDKRALTIFLDEYRPGHGARVKPLWALLSGQQINLLENRAQLFEALRSLFGALAAQESLFLWLEDLHRADQASLELLNFLARCPDDELPLILVSYRAEELAASSALSGLMRDLQQEARATHLDLERLTLEAVEDLIANVLPQITRLPQAAARLHGESRGNPFILRELLEILRSRKGEENALTADPDQWILPMPARLQDLVDHRLSELTDEERELLELAAVEGEAFSAEVLAALLEERKIRILRSLQTLERRTRLIQAREGRFLFDHALIRRALYESLGDEIRCEYHRLIAEYMIRSEGEQSGSAGAIAHHWLGAGDQRQAVPWLLRAGVHARDLYAFHEARLHLDQARDIADLLWLAEPEDEIRRIRLDALREQGVLEMAEGAYESAARLFTSARDLLVPIIEEELRSELLRLSGEAMHYAGRKEEAARDFKAALACCGRDCRLQQAKILRSRAFMESKQDLWDEALASCNAALLLSEAYPREVLAIEHTMGTISMTRGDLTEARRIFEEIVSRADDEREQYLRTAALANLGTVLWRQGESDEAARCLEESLTIRRQLGLVIEYAQILTNLAIIRMRSGRLDDARELLTEATELKERIGDVVGIASVEISLGNLEARSGRFRQALTHFEKAARLHFKGGNRARAAVALHNCGEALLEMGKPEEAVEPLTLAREIREDLNLRSALASTLRTLARLESARGSVDKAGALFGEAAGIARSEGSVEDLIKVEIDRMNFILQSDRPTRGAEVQAILDTLGTECSVWPPPVFKFDIDLVAAGIARAGGQVDDAWKILIGLLDRNPQDKDPYRRARILQVILTSPWPDSYAERLTVRQAEFESLVAEKGYDCL